MNRTTYLITALAILFCSCKKPYAPKMVASGGNYLVVEGVIGTGQDSTIIKLSRTVPLSSFAARKAELGGSVTLESDAGVSYPLIGIDNGYYVSTALNLSASNKYRLKIVTSDNKIYQSDFVAVKNSAPIDSVTYQVEDNGLQVNVSTHDASNSTRYYRWEYQETWIIHSAFSSSSVLVKSPNDTIVYRLPSDQIAECWKSAISSTIILGSSAKLTNDVITDNSLIFIDASAEKLSDRYSILVKQYALTKDGFNYWQQLKKNTEQLGGVFDPQPSEIIGNIHCVSNPSEPVIGYIGAGSATKKRIFIDNRDLPAWHAILPTAGCKLDTLLFARFIPPKTTINEVKDYLYTGFLFPVNAVLPPGAPRPTGYTASTAECVDCTLRGTNKKPDFWIDR